jgi:hypothetical protein
MFKENVLVKLNYKFLIYGFLLLISLIFISSVSADERLTATVDKTDITIDEQVTLNITANGEKTSDPEIPYSKDFNFNLVGSSSKVSIINNNMTASQVMNTSLLLQDRVNWLSLLSKQ